MAITLGDLTFDPAHTTVREQHEEVGGRDARRIELTGVISGPSTVEAVEAALDAILAAASQDQYDAELSLRAGRRLLVRRLRFSREVSRESRVGAFRLLLEARDPFEESVEPTIVPWELEAPGATLGVAAQGNVDAFPVFTVAPQETLVNPAFSDGSRCVAYAGAVAPGQTLVLDGAAGAAFLDGEDVTPYTSGRFPRISPAGTTLVYAGDPAGGHRASVTVAFRDRWW